MSISAIQELFDTFLAALADPDGGAALYGMYAPEAIVRRPDGTGPLQGVTRAAFAEVHRELCREGAGLLPRFERVMAPAGPGLVPGDSAAATPATGMAPVLDLASATGERVAWFDVFEAREQRTVVAALGLKAIEGQWRIGWCTLASQVEPWPYRDGLLQSAADYPWMRTTQPARARALLDASYFRRHARADVTFSSLEDARFSCQMSTDCCRHDFEITLPPEAQIVIDAMPWETVRPQLQGTQLAMRPDGKLQLKALNETCRFLGAQSQCLIHQTLGRQPFGPCSVFPFAFAQTPDGIAVSMSPICGASRRGLGLTLAAREEDLRERLVQAEPRRPSGFRLAPDVEVSWEQFRDTEKVLCEVLAATELPMRRRLYVGSRLLGALRGGEPVDMNGWVAQPPGAISDELREAIRGLLGRVLGWDRATLRGLPQAVPTNLAALEMLEQPVITRILQNTLFCKNYSYTFDLTTAYNFLIVLYLVALMMQAAANGLLSEAMWRELGALGVHGLLKSVLHEGVPEGFRSVFGTADFGQWLLVA